MRRLVIILLAVSCCACMASGPRVVLRGETFHVEIVDDPGNQQLGLMFRDELAPDAGMLFVFPGEAPRSFWMRNMRISIDILYFDAERRLVNWYDSVPPCRTEQCPGYPSDAPAQFVLEISAGRGRELGVARGDRLTIHP